MFSAHMRQNLLYAAMLLVAIGAVNYSGMPQAATIREYIRFAVNTDLDMQVIAEKARGLGEFGARVSWEDILHTLAPGRYPVVPRLTP